jgi:CBS domain-containing protein
MSVAAYCRRTACTARPQDGLRETAVRMEKEGVGLLVVMEEDAPVGVVSDRDLALALGRDAGRSVADVMSRPAIAVADDASVEEAMGLMRDRRVRRLPVIDAEERVVGLISADDLVLLLAREIGGLGEVLVAQLPAGGSRPVGREGPAPTSVRLTEHYTGPVVSLPLDASVARVVRAMEAHTVGAVVVTEDDERAAGVVTDRDVALRVVARGLDPEKTRVASIMSTPLVAAQASEPLEEVVGRMRAAGVRRLPVLREGHAVGIVTFDDLLATFGRELDRLGRCVAGEVRTARLRHVSSRVRREVEERLEDAAGQLRRLGDQTLRSLGRELEDVVERVTAWRPGQREARSLCVEELMQTDVRVCRPSEAVAEAARIMWERDCGCVPVVAEDGSGRVVGMVTDRDVCMASWSRGTPPSRIPVGEVMARRVHVCHPDDDVAEAELLMRSAQVRRLPVTDEAGHLRGILSLADLARAATGAHGLPAGAVGAGEVGVVLEAICRPRSEVSR